MNNKFEILSFDTLTSTNSFAEELIKKGIAKHYQVIKTDFQTQGRGLKGNSWYGTSSLNLMISLIFQPECIAPINQFELNKVIALATAKTCEELLQPKKVYIKWPNDIYVDNKKVSGILIEHIIAENKLKWTIAGIGINVLEKSFDKHLPNPTSLTLLNPDITDVNQCFDKLLKNIDYFYLKLLQENRKEIHNDYLSFLLFFDMMRPYRYKDQSINAKITGIDDIGFLCLTTDSGNKIVCDLKDIVYLF